MSRMIYPKEKKKRLKQSVPLKRSIHIDGKRWGWEYVEGFDHETGEDKSKIKVVSPDNKFYMKRVTATSLPTGIMLPRDVKQFIIDELISGL